MSFLCSCGNQTDNEEVIGGIVLHTCDACLQRIHKETTWELEGEQYQEDTVICPYCGHEYEKYDAYGFDLGGEDEIECERCGKKFDLEVREVRLFTTKRSLCEMPADWGESDGDT